VYGNSRRPRLHERVAQVEPRPHLVVPVFTRNPKCERRQIAFRECMHAGGDEEEVRPFFGFVFSISSVVLLVRQVRVVGVGLHTHSSASPHSKRKDRAQTPTSAAVESHNPAHARAAHSPASAPSPFSPSTGEGE
jgi:hypothetical protein